MASPSIPTLSAHGADMPAIGFGTSSLGDCGEIVASALSLGYRHIDTAWKYGTERGVGEGIRASGVPRNEIFLTTKVSHEYLRADDFARSVEQSLKTLGVDFVDLLLVHWPNPEIPLSEPIPARKERTLAQIALRWLIQQGNIVPIPRSSNAARMAENLNIFDFALTDEEMARIAALKRPDGRIANPAGRAPAWD